MNGYFQLVITPKGTGIKVFAPTGGGSSLHVNDVRDYLDNRKIQYDVVVINNAVTKADESVVIFTDVQIMPEREAVKFDISKDHMLVTAFFYPPTVGAELLTEKEVLSSLAYRRVNYGIQTEAIHKFFEQRQYCTEIVVARGKPVEEGQNAFVEYHFNLNNRPKPTLNADGSVDYFNLNIINNVQEGQLLATLHPEIIGKSGINVHGETIKPHSVKNAFIKYGRNTILSEDKLTLKAGRSGHVTVQDGKISVSDVLSVKNVDVSTGNIEYEGSVEVNGMVAANFSVKAGGNIIVKDIVEGATLDAGADVLLECGVKAGGNIRAGGSVITKFIENASVTAGGGISSESILHSNVSSGTEINVAGKRGFISGGKVSAADKITAKILGSEMGANTFIEVGADPMVKQRLKELQKSIAAANKNIESIRPTIEGFTKMLKAGVKFTPDQVMNAKKLMALNKTLNDQIDNDSEEYSDLMDRLSDFKDAEVIVEGTAYPGTTVTIGELSMIIKKPVQHSKFEVREGDVRLAPI
ncbi:MAG: FapA family protein [Butyrivibrio sp.]|nr:FapA family protein [Butyrivibrio sp.]